MILTEFHLGLRQAVMALMNWAIDVPHKLLQSDAKTISSPSAKQKDKEEDKEELIIKKSSTIKYKRIVVWNSAA